MSLPTANTGRNFFVFSLTAMIFLLSQGCTSNTGTKAPVTQVPDDLAIAGPVVARVKASGFQVYTFKADAAGKLLWILKAPDATFDDGNGLKGKHYAGPTWESTVDGSKVVGLKIAEHASPDAGAISWLLLKATTHGGTGVLSNVTFIQRINTSGGKAPTIGDAKEGDESRVPYSAEYIFYGPGAAKSGANGSGGY